MKNGALLRVSISTTPEADDAVAEVLADIFGVPAVVHADLEQGTTLASVYLEHPPARLAQLRRLLRARLQKLRQDGVNVGTCRTAARSLGRKNWAESWKRHFQPQVIEGTLLIKPSWCRRRPRPGQAEVVMDPGLSFGTGQHPTTNFCLRQLVAAAGPSPGCGQAFLDLGTGSGILAITAAKLGYGPVVALDCDADAVRIAGANAQANRVRQNIHIFRKDLAHFHWRGRPFDVVCANLIDDLLIRERHRILGCVKRGGLLVLAGILHQHFADVARAYAAAGARLIHRQRAREWESGAFRVGSRVPA